MLLHKAAGVEDMEGDEGENIVKILRLSGGICAVSGVMAGGVRDGRNGLALIVGGGPAAGMFTANRLRAAPVQITAKRVGYGKISAIIANSGCANAFTGDEGYEKAIKMGDLVSSRFNIHADEVAVASTGPIGKPLDMDLITKQFQKVAKSLSDGPEGSSAAASAIMTTDTYRKEEAVAVFVRDAGQSAGSAGGRSAERCVARIGGIAKGSGMIFPHLQEATMLAFIYTDAALSAETLRKCLREAVENSFNMIVVDGDMSTNDMVLLVSSSTNDSSTSSAMRDESDEREMAAFQKGLDFVCMSLARMIARDGEGATKFMEVHVRGAASVEDARRAARAVARSPLVKCSLFGEKPFWGRVIAALGASDVEIERKKLKMWVSGSRSDRILVASDGRILNVMDARRMLMGAREIRLEIDLGVGNSSATAWGCDLSYEYVRINAE